MTVSTKPATARHGSHAVPRARSWSRGRAAAVALTVAAVGAGTWLLGAGADKPATGSGPADLRSLPAGSAPPLAVAPPPSARGTVAAAKPNKRSRSVAAGAR